MKEVMARLTEWLGTFVELLKVMIVLGVAIGILYGDTFGVISHLWTTTSYSQSKSPNSCKTNRLMLYIRFS